MKCFIIIKALFARARKSNKICVTAQNYRIKPRDVGQIWANGKLILRRKYYQNMAMLTSKLKAWTRNSEKFSRHIRHTLEWNFITKKWQCQRDAQYRQKWENEVLLLSLLCAKKTLAKVSPSLAQLKVQELCAKSASCCLHLSLALLQFAKESRIQFKTHRKLSRRQSTTLRRRLSSGHVHVLHKWIKWNYSIFRFINSFSAIQLARFQEQL